MSYKEHKVREPSHPERKRETACLHNKIQVAWTEMLRILEVEYIRVKEEGSQFTMHEITGPVSNRNACDPSYWPDWH